jgi:hypothetical protein
VKKQELVSREAIDEENKHKPTIFPVKIKAKADFAGAFSTTKQNPGYFWFLCHTKQLFPQMHK